MKIGVELRALGDAGELFADARALEAAGADSFWARQRAVISVRLHERSFDRGIRFVWAGAVAALVLAAALSWSPINCHLRQAAPRRVAASALPTPNGRPCPSDPVENSTPVTRELICVMRSEPSVP